jgi:hypothetical protein
LYTSTPLGFVDFMHCRMQRKTIARFTLLCTVAAISSRAKPAAAQVCSAENCGSGCSGTTCAHYCTGKQCASRCSGWQCGNKCTGDGCAAGCTGKSCGHHCKGDNCAANCSGETGCGFRCTGKDCAANCLGKLSCRLADVGFSGSMHTRGAPVLLSQHASICGCWAPHLLGGYSTVPTPYQPQIKC